MATVPPRPSSAGISRFVATAVLLATALTLLAGVALVLSERPYSHAFHDELHYAQQARDVAGGGFPRYNGVFAPKYPPLYGVALAPVRAAAGPNAFAWWARLFNVLLAVSALIPAYRLARITLPRGWAVTAAVLGLLGAYQVYTRLMLSENLFTPLFLWSTLALVRACRRPTAGRAVTAGLLIGFAALTKSLMIVMAPAVVLAVVWSVRSIGPTLRACAWIGLGAAIPTAAWRFRGVVFASEGNLREVFSYWNELCAAGLLEVTDYVHWTRVAGGAWVLAIATPVIALAVAGLLARLFDRRRANRSLAAFALLSSVGVTVFTGIWMAQISFYKQAVHERYLVFLWPLMTIAFVDRLARPARGGLSIGGIVAGVALAAALVVLVPADVFDPGPNLGYFIDCPSAEQGYRFWNLAGGSTGVRLLLLAPLLALPLLLLRRRLIGVVAVLLLSTAFAAGATHAVYQKLKQSDLWVRGIEDPVLDWLETQWRPGDAIICHGPMWNVHYRVCARFGLPYSRVGSSGRPRRESAVVLDAERGAYRFLGARPTGRILFLTGDAKVAPGREFSTFRELRLIELDGGQAPPGLAVTDRAP